MSNSNEEAPNEEKVRLCCGAVVDLPPDPEKVLKLETPCIIEDSNGERSIYCEKIPKEGWAQYLKKSFVGATGEVIKVEPQPDFFVAIDMKWTDGTPKMKYIAGVHADKVSYRAILLALLSLIGFSFVLSPTLVFSQTDNSSSTSSKPSTTVAYLMGTGVICWLIGGLAAGIGIFVDNDPKFWCLGNWNPKMPLIRSLAIIGGGCYGFGIVFFTSVYFLSL